MALLALTLGNLPAKVNLNYNPHRISSAILMLQKDKHVAPKLKCTITFQSLLAVFIVVSASLVASHPVPSVAKTSPIMPK